MIDWPETHEVLATSSSRSVARIWSVAYAVWLSCLYPAWSVREPNWPPVIPAAQPTNESVENSVLVRSRWYVYPAARLHRSAGAT